MSSSVYFVTDCILFLASAHFTSLFFHQVSLVHHLRTRFKPPALYPLHRLTSLEPDTLVQYTAAWTASSDVSDLGPYLVRYDLLPVISALTSYMRPMSFYFIPLTFPFIVSIYNFLPLTFVLCLLIHLIRYVLPVASDGHSCVPV